MKCEAITCQYCKLETTNYSYGYCQIKNPDIKDNGTCKNYQERKIVIK